MTAAWRRCWWRPGVPHPRAAVAELVDLDPLAIELFISQRDIAAVRAGITAEVRFATSERRDNAPSTQWWTQLSSAIAGGLAFATVLTLVLTPCLLLLGDQLAARLRRRLNA